MSEAASQERIARAIERSVQVQKDIAGALKALNENFVAFVKKLEEWDTEVTVAHEDQLTFMDGHGNPISEENPGE